MTACYNYACESEKVNARRLGSIGMMKSGFIFGAVTFVLFLGSAITITPFCAPCLGLILGIAAGYVACIYDRPTSSRESIQKGAIAAAIAAGIGFFGSLIGGAINGVIVTPAMIESFARSFYITNINLTQTQILTYQLIFGVLVGIFDVVWMAVLGIAGGALWFQVVGKKRTPTVLPRQDTLPPGI
jgi:hypothetical protein